MADFTISEITHYASVIDTSKFIDFAIQLGVLDKKAYCDISFLSKKQQLNVIFNKIAEKGSQYIDLVHKRLMRDFPNINEIIEDDYKFNKCLVQGSIPKLPFYYVNREFLTNKLKRSLETLQLGESLVIHGMVGYGKSCLVNAALRDKHLAKHFDYQIFWINFENINPEDNLLLLNRRICELLNLPNSCGSPKDNLRKLFQSSIDLKNALLVLDNVNDKDIIHVFNLGWKRVITTQLKDIIKECDDHIEVNKGFLWKDVLKMFKRSLSTNEIFEEEALHIYNSCNGHPVVINMICQYLWKNRHSKNDRDLWLNIQDKLLTGDYMLDHQSTLLSDIYRRLKTSIRQLSLENLISKFYDLAIFPIDVNIPLTVLQILWNLPELNVRNIMSTFCENSLIVQSYCEKNGKYVYAIHKVLAYYLKSEFKDQLQIINRQLIAGYHRLTRGDFQLLPDDNYSFCFLGYHLAQSHLDAFSIYTDLLFLEAYLKKAGKYNVLNDMDTFQRFYTNMFDHDVLVLQSRRFTLLKDLINKFGSILYNFPNIDIIQYVFQDRAQNWPSLPIERTNNRLLFKFLTPFDEELKDYEEIRMSEDISCAAFTTLNYILVGCCQGSIKLFYGLQNKEICTFSGHSSSVKKLVVSPDKKYFLSISDDGLMIWKLPLSIKPCTEGALSYIPQIKQSNWKDFFCPENSQTYWPKKTFKLEDDELVTAAFYEEFSKWPYIVTGSSQGCCTIYDIRTGMIVLKPLVVSSELTCVCLTRKKLIFSYDILIEIRGISIGDNSSYDGSSMTLFNDDNVIDFFYSKQHMLSVSSGCIHAWNLNFSDSSNKQLYKFKSALKAKRYVSSVLTKDSKYLLLNTDIGAIYIWDTIKRETVTEFKIEGHIRSLDTSCKENNTGQIMLISSDRKMLQQYSICSDSFKGGNSNTFLRTSQVHWKDNQVYVLLVSSDNKIRIYRGLSLISETDTINSEITCMCFSCGDYVVYGLENGQIWVFSIKERIYYMLNSIDNRGPIRFVDCIEMTDSYLVDNMNTSRDWDMNSNCNTAKFLGLVIAICDEYLSIHSGFESHAILERFNPPVHLFKNPSVFYMRSNLFLIDQYCNIFTLDLKSRNRGMVKIKGYSHLNFRISAMSFCASKGCLVLAASRNGNSFLDLVCITEREATLMDSWKIESEAISCAISHDGVFVAAGFNDGKILIWDVSERKEHFLPQYHTDSVDHLLFSPNINLILISLSSVVAIWSLELFAGPSEAFGFELLSHFDTPTTLVMDYNYWCNRKPYKDGCLLSCLRFHAKPVYLSHSGDFSTFFVMDDKNKIYIFKIADYSY
ncbi:death-associated APAF1-related killer isoform X2 [Rhynchophorus ferrugineus]|uniref:death-associated APAF1-related killer isoform X2 n=1 Tax=Rhynchophorus ferrugineus TaxID=354439 RepID=UPI003FCCEF27